MNQNTIGVNEVIKRAEKKGSHFFDADTMRFFKSRISDTAYVLGTDIYFITSERRDHTVPRYWTVRKCDIEGNIDTIGEFQGYNNLNEARHAIKSILEAKGA